jgi:hypothetical protein
MAGDSGVSLDLPVSGGEGERYSLPPNLAVHGFMHAGGLVVQVGYVCVCLCVYVCVCL